MDKVYIISLPSKQDRRSKIKNRLSSLGLDYEFVDAVTPDSPEVLSHSKGSDLNGFRLPFLKEMNCTIGKEYACFTSHLLTLKKIIDSGKSGIVIEDDALLCKDFVERFHSLDKNTSLIMLYTEAITNKNYTSGIHDINNNWCTTGYWISHSYAIQAYEKYNIQFIDIPYVRTSECITMFSGGKFVIPQMILEDPLNSSDIRDTSYDSKLRNYHALFTKYINYEDYTQSESEEYKKLLSEYLNFITDKSYSFGHIKENELDKEQISILNFMKSKSILHIPENYLQRKETIPRSEYRIYLSPDKECYSEPNGFDISTGEEAYADPPIFIKDPIYDKLNDKSIIKSHVENQKKYNYQNYLENRSVEYKYLLDWYFRIYINKEKNLLKINIDNLTKREKEFYYNLVLAMAWDIDRDYGVQICKRIHSEVPVDLYSDYEENMEWYFTNNKKSLLIVANSGLHFDPDSVKTGMFGSEEAAIYLGECLANKYNVTICNRSYIKNRFSLPGNNPRYITDMPNTKYDYVILWRYFQDVSHMSNKIYSWHHDTWFGGQYGFDTENCDKVNGMFMLSDWHIQTYSEKCRLKNPIKIGNGIVTKHFDGPRTMTNPHSLIYTSAYDRGLFHLISMWPEVKQKFPNATLDICYGWNMWNTPKEEIPKYQQYLKNMSDRYPGSIREHGTVGHQELIRLMKNSSIWAYPCHFYETFCITGVKMQACGVIPVVINLAALDEIVLSGYKVDGNIPFAEKVSIWKNKLFECMELVVDESKFDRNEIARKAKERFSWDRTCDIIVKELES